MPTLDTLRQQTIDDPEIPEPVRRFLAAGAPLEHIHLDAFGQWSHEGEPFINQKLARLFHQSLHRTEQGTWYLHIAPYTYPVTVALTDRFIDRVRGDGPRMDAHFIGALSDEWTPLHLESLYTDGHDLLATTHQGRPLRFVGTAYRDLLERLEMNGEDYRLRFQDVTLPVSPLPVGFFHPPRN